MSDREKFEDDAVRYGFDLERANQRVPTVEPWDQYEDINTGHRWGGFLSGTESKQAELDKANERIAQLEEAIIEHREMDSLWIEDNDEWARYIAARKKLFSTIDKPPSTWLLEHDKAVEVNVLAEVNNRIYTISTSSQNVVAEMIDARK